MTSASASPSHGKRFLRALDGELLARPPVWLMRQAGRYLPEYREVRAKAGSFLNLCYSPALAAEVTLQPIRRFGFDAAILFSDILVVPDALGQNVTFVEGEGPLLSPVLDPDSIARLPNIDLGKLAPVFETIERVRAGLPDETAFIGFCGAPWTVASYMIGGRGSRDLEPVRLFAYRHPEAFQQLIDKLVEASIAYLSAQAKAGVEAVQIFDSWAGLLPGREFEKWCVRPVIAIIKALRALHPHLKIIAFPREAGGHLQKFAQAAVAEGARPDGIGLGVAEDVAMARSFFGPKQCLQGNLDPLALLAGGTALEAAIDGVLADYAGGPHIFNLGHGILPPTPIAHVERMLAKIRST
jgi:uroporphyrinogen decarboxylase